MDVLTNELASVDEILTRSLSGGTDLTEQECNFLRALGRFGQMLVSPSDADTAHHLAVVGLREDLGYRVSSGRAQC